MILLKKLFDPKFIKFLITGVSAFALDLVILNIIAFVFFQGKNATALDLISLSGISISFELLISILGFISIPKLISASIALTFNFFMNRTWVFKTEVKDIRNQGIKFVGVSLFNLVLVTSLYSVYYSIFRPAFDNLHFANALLLTFSNLASEATKMIVSFILYKYFVFK